MSEESVGESVVGQEPILMVLRFDPLGSSASELMRKIFSHNFGKAFYLLWRRGHLVGPDFEQHCEIIVDRFDAAKPESIPELVALFPRNSNFMPGDVKAFCYDYWSYLVGDAEVTYEVKLAESVNG